MRISDWSSDVCSSDLFSLRWHDSSGPIGDDAKGLATRAALEALPGCVDVQLGAIVGFGMVTSGLRDSTQYVASAHPRLFLPNHHDAWLPILGGGAAAYEPQWRAALATPEIGRPSCRERVWQYVEISVVAVALKKKKIKHTKP